MDSAETKRITNPRAEIDTSPPFESVKEAVNRFGGGAPWIPLHLLRLPANENESFETENIEEQALQLENDLNTKEHETRSVLRELEAAKRLVETLKLNLMPEFSSFLVELPDYDYDKSVTDDDGFTLSPPVSFTELSHAKLNLSRTSVDLGEIQASLESLNRKLGKEDDDNDNDEVSPGRRADLQVPISSDWGSSSEENHHMSMINRYLDERFGTGDILSLSNEVNKEESFEAEQFRKLTQASRYEVMRAMSEIERTKDSIRMAEMRLNAAKKMEEAAKAVQTIALAGRSNAVFLNGEDSSDIFQLKNDGALKADWARDLYMTKTIQKFEDEEVSIKKHVVTEQTRNNNYAKFKFRNSYAGHRNTNALCGNDGPYVIKEEPKTSIGDVIGRKLAVQDDAMMGRRTQDHSEKGRVSLSQMLREQRRDTLRPDNPRGDVSVDKPRGDVNVEKRPFFQRKKFGFIQLPVYAKQSKKKGQNFNVPAPLGAVSSV